MMKAIFTKINNTTTNAKMDIYFISNIARIPGVDQGTIEVYHTLIDDNTRKFMGINGSFMWHDHKIKFQETFNGKITIEYDGQKIGEVFWSALYGRLESIPETGINKAQGYVLDIFWKIVRKMNKNTRHIALPKEVQYGEAHIWAEGATIYVRLHDEVIPAMGNKITGEIVSYDDYRLVDLQKVIKRAFLV